MENSRPSGPRKAPRPPPPQARKPASPHLPDGAQGDLTADVTITRGLLLSLREGCAMFCDVVYWETGRQDDWLLRSIVQADEALIASNPAP